MSGERRVWEVEKGKGRGLRDLLLMIHYDMLLQECPISSSSVQNRSTSEIKIIRAGRTKNDEMKNERGP